MADALVAAVSLKVFDQEHLEVVHLYLNVLYEIFALLRGQAPVQQDLLALGLQFTELPVALVVNVYKDVGVWVLTVELVNLLQCTQILERLEPL